MNKSAFMVLGLLVFITTLSYSQLKKINPNPSIRNQIVSSAKTNDYLKLDSIISDHQKIYFTYDIYGNSKSTTEYTWNSYLSKWEGSINASFNYNSKNQLISDTMYSWSDFTDSWYYYWLVNYDYTDSDIRRMWESYKYDPIKGQWIGQHKEEHFFNSYDKDTLTIEYEWDEIIQDWIFDYKYQVNYSGDNQKNAIYTFEWDKENNRWDSINKSIYVWNELNQNIMVTDYYWNVDSHQWTGTTKVINSFESNGFLFEALNQNYSLEEKYWINAFRSEYSLIGDTNVCINSQWNIAKDLWDFRARKHLRFDVNNNLLLDETFIWDRASSQWIYSSSYVKHEKKYDENNNLTSELFLYWDEDINNWISGEKTEYIYDDNFNLLTTIEYYWSQIDFIWKNAYKKSCYFDYAIESAYIIYPTQGISINYNMNMLHNKCDSVIRSGWNKNLQKWIENDTSSYFYSHMELPTYKNDIINESDIQIYPNPFHSILYIKCDPNFEVKSIRVFDFQGKLLSTINDPSDKIDLSHLNSGMYFILLFDKNNFSVLKKSIKIY